jgi:hypothetical protein
MERLDRGGDGDYPGVVAPDGDYPGVSAATVIAPVRTRLRWLPGAIAARVPVAPMPFAFWRDVGRHVI